MNCEQKPMWWGMHKVTDTPKDKIEKKCTFATSYIEIPKMVCK